VRAARALSPARALGLVGGPGYDVGEWDDPPGKLALLYDLEHISVLLRDGNEPFHPDRDRIPFTRYLITIGCQPPPEE
jgi:hypothetical protein